MSSRPSLSNEAGSCHGLGSENMEVDALGILSRDSCGLMGLGDEGMALYRVHEKDGFRQF